MLELEGGREGGVSRPQPGDLLLCKEGPISGRGAASVAYSVGLRVRRALSLLYSPLAT